MFDEEPAMGPEDDDEEAEAPPVVGASDTRRFLPGVEEEW